MAFQIRISPDALRAAAERQKSVLSTIDETKSKMTAMISMLNQAWDGGASSQAIGTLEELRNLAGNLGEGANGGANKLESIAQAFEALDDGEDSPFVAVRFDDRITQLVGCPAPRPNFPLVFSGSLRIVPDQVRNVATQCKQLTEVYVGIVDELRNSLNTLEGEWEGKSFLKFANECEELIKAFKRMANVLEEFADRIRTVATRYEEIDNMF